MRFWIAPCRPAANSSQITTAISCSTMWGLPITLAKRFCGMSPLPQSRAEVTALVGPSGSSKTTVSRLAARFWDYQKGSITVGGMAVSRIDPEKLMSLYSIVFQDVTLFDNTILKTSVWGARVPPTRRSLRRQSWQTARNLPKNCPTVGTPTSVRTAVSSPAASGSAFPSPVLF